MTNQACELSWGNSSVPVYDCVHLIERPLITQIVIEVNSGYILFIFLFIEETHEFLGLDYGTFSHDQMLRVV